MLAIEIKTKGVNGGEDKVEIIRELTSELKKRGVFDIDEKGVTLNMAVNPYGIGAVDFEGGRVCFSPGKNVARVETAPTLVRFSDGRVMKVVEVG